MEEIYEDTFLNNADEIPEEVLAELQKAWDEARTLDLKASLLSG